MTGSFKEGQFCALCLVRRGLIPHWGSCGLNGKRPPLKEPHPIHSRDLTPYCGILLDSCRKDRSGLRHIFMTRKEHSVHLFFSGWNSPGPLLAEVHVAGSTMALNRRIHLLHELMRVVVEIVFRCRKSHCYALRMIHANPEMA